MSETLGQTLEKARRGLGKSIADAEADTRIRGKLLQALENGQYESLPSPAYVKGYLISYAKFLELDPAPLIDLYERETGTTSPRPPVRLPEQVVAPRSQSQHIPFKAALVVVAALLVIGAGAWGISRLTDGPEPPPPLPSIPETTSTAGTEPTDTAGSPGVSDPDAEPDEPDDPETPGAPFTLRVEIASDSASWLRVTVDGLVAYEGTMAGGQTSEWEVAENASLRIGRPAAVTVLRDGVALEIPSGDPPVLEVDAADPVPAPDTD